MKIPRNWRPDPIADAIISELQEELDPYKRLVSELDMEIDFLRKFLCRRCHHQAHSDVNETRILFNPGRKSISHFEEQKNRVLAFTRCEHIMRECQD